VSEQLLTLRPLVVPSAKDRERLQRRARLLAWGGNAWHLIEFGIAIGAGIAAGSIALIGFGADSLIEGLAGFVIVWLFTGSRLHSDGAERRAQQLVAASYFILAAYVEFPRFGGHLLTEFARSGRMSVDAKDPALLVGVPLGGREASS